MTKPRLLDSTPLPNRPASIWQGWLAEARFHHQQLRDGVWEAGSPAAAEAESTMRLAYAQALTLLRRRGRGRHHT